MPSRADLPDDTVARTGNRGCCFNSAITAKIERSLLANIPVSTVGRAGIRRNCFSSRGTVEKQIFRTRHLTCLCRRLAGGKGTFAIRSRRAAVADFFIPLTREAAGTFSDSSHARIMGFHLSSVRTRLIGRLHAHDMRFHDRRTFPTPSHARIVGFHELSGTNPSSPPLEHLAKLMHARFDRTRYRPCHRWPAMRTTGGGDVIGTVLCSWLNPRTTGAVDGCKLTEHK